MKQFINKLRNNQGPPAPEVIYPKLIQNTIRAIAAMDRSDWKAAITLWESVLRNAAGSAPEDVYIKLSLCYRNTQDFVSSNETIDKALDNFASSKALLVERAEIASAQKDWPEAQKRWKRVLEEHETSAPEICFVRLSFALAKTQATTDAKQIIKKGLSLFPSSLSIRAAEARVLMEAQDWKQASKTWLQILDLHEPLFTDSLYAEVIKSLRSDKNFVQASTVYANAMRRFRGSVPVLVEHAEIASAQKDWPEAQKRWQLVLDEYKDSSQLTQAIELRCRFNISVLRRLRNLSVYKKDISNYMKTKVSRKKIVVYTAYSKGYDTLKLPEMIDPSFEYVCYTDDPDADGFGVFDIRPFPLVVDGDSARTIRYPKTHPHVLFADYDLVVWIDTSIMLTGDIKPLLNTFLRSKYSLGSTPHPERVSLEEEYRACINFMKDDPKIMRQQIDAYKKEGFEPKSFAENGVLLFKPGSKELGRALDTWWKQILTFSKRDQLSFSYAVDSHNLSWFKLTEKPNNMRNHPDLVIADHGSQNELLNELYKELKY